MTQKQVISVPQPISTLAGLTDVNLSLPSGGQVLSYDYATSKWVNYTIPAAVSYYNTISYSLSGSVAIPQAMKHTPNFTTANGWYMPAGTSGVLQAIGIQCRSVNAAAVGRTVTVELRSYVPNNNTQRILGAGTLATSQVVYTSAVAGTRWDGAGQVVLGSPVTLTAGNLYYLDISQINLTMDDVTVTLYIDGVA